MSELTEHLTNLEKVLEHQETFALEELADRLSTLLGGKSSEYRRAPRMDNSTAA